MVIALQHILLHAMVWMILWFVRTLAVAAVLLIVIFLIIAICSWMRGDEDDGA